MDLSLSPSSMPGLKWHILCHQWRSYLAPSYLQGLVTKAEGNALAQRQKQEFECVLLESDILGYLYGFEYIEKYLQCIDWITVRYCNKSTLEGRLVSPQRITLSYWCGQQRAKNSASVWTASRKFNGLVVQDKCHLQKLSASCFLI